jgi:hypothetical protein
MNYRLVSIFLSLAALYRCLHAEQVVADQSIYVDLKGVGAASVATVIARHFDVNIVIGPYGEDKKISLRKSYPSREWLMRLP